MTQTVRPALKMLIVMLLLLGGVYPLCITLISQVAWSKEAGGSLIKRNDKVIGSELVAQNFKEASYFWPRPSAVDFDPIKPAGGSNLGPSSQKLKAAVEERIKKFDSLPPSELAYTSGSGIDPHISLDVAYYQIERVAKHRSIAVEELHRLVNSLVEGYGAQYVNVLMLNLAVDQHFPLQHL